MKSLKFEVINALRWTAAGRIAGQFGSWAITVYVIRLLTPADYGLMSMAAVLTGFAMLISELGVVPALIQSQRMDHRLLRQLFGCVIVLAVVTFSIVFLASPALAIFFNDSRLISITRVLAVSMLIGGLSAVPMALLERELRFRGISLLEFISTTIGGGTTLVLAIKGFGVWSLVVGNLVAVLIKSLGVLIISKFWVLPVFSLRGLRPIFIFGANITGQRILWYINSQADVVLVGKLLGNHALGIYSVGFQLANLPVSKVLTIINRVAFPAYARLQHDKRQATNYFLVSVELGCFIFCPMLWGMSSVSHELIEVLMGRNWEDAYIVLTLVPLLVPFRAVFGLMYPLIDGLGYPNIGLKNQFTALLLVPPAVLIGTRWDLTGVCVGLICASVLALIVNVRRTLKVIKISPACFLGAMGPSVFAAAIMYVGVWLIGKFALSEAPPLGRLCAMVATGIIVYGVISFFVNRKAIWYISQLLRVGRVSSALT